MSQGRIRPEDIARSTSTPRPVERVLIVERISGQKLAAVMAGEGAGVFSLGGVSEQYQSDWNMVSHTFQVQDNDTAVITYLLERG